MTALSTPGFATQQEAYDALIRQGASPQIADILAAITRPESSGYTAANNGTYYGLWQIGNYHGFNNQLLLSDNIDYQAAAALSIYRQQGLGAWETYTNGSYQKYLNQQNSAALPPQPDLSNFNDVLQSAPKPQQAPLIPGSILDSPGSDPNGLPSIIDSPTGQPSNSGTNVLNSPNGFGPSATDSAAMNAAAAAATQQQGASNG